MIDLHGKPMVQRVVEQAQRSDAEKVIVATDDERVASAVAAFGGEVCMTSSEHPSGTDRLQEVCSLMSFEDDEVIVNVQGDEPLMPPAVINQVARNLTSSGMQIATLSEPITDLADFLDPNIVKVVCDGRSLAMYFSRAPIPFSRDNYLTERSVENNINLPTQLICRRHLGIYAYRVSLLNDFIHWEVTAVEEVEKLEQLRALYNGVNIHVAESLETIPPGIDTQSDLDRTLDLLANSSELQ